AVMARLAPPLPTSPLDRPRGGLGGRLAGLSPSGRARVPAAWALYDFANTIFSYAVVSTAIGLWLTDPDRFGRGPGQLVLTISVVISVGINALVSPPLGALSDRGGRRLPFLLVFTVLTIVPAALIGFSAPVVGAILFIVANFSFQAALIYYDATLATVSYPATRGKLAGIGVGVGYLGTITIALLLIVLDLPVASYFPISMALFAVMAIPIFVFVRERGTGAPAFRWADARRSFGQVRATIDHARAVPGLGRFLVGRFFYTDAVNTIIVVMSVVAVRAVGLTEQQFLMLTVLLTVVAVTASFGWGRLVDRFGPRRTLLWVLSSWAAGLLIGLVSLSLPGTPVGIGLFVVAGAIVGSGLGGVQVADRVFMLRLSPPARVGEFFGLYGLVGKGSQVVGQTLFGVTIFLLLDTLGTGAYQVAIFTLLTTMTIGYLLVRPVSDRWAGSVDAQPPGDGAEGAPAAA
ncbi:MAG TPA: MFS transporter, partial [Patescibacteria group bacterium]|nr:MFS transporter [Patescibacteria group bacterium]